MTFMLHDYMHDTDSNKSVIKMSTVAMILMQYDRDLLHVAMNSSISVS